MPALVTIGQMEEYIRIERGDPPLLTVASLTRASTTATVTTVLAHGFITGDYVTIADANQAAYNGTFQVTVTGTKTFTFTVAGSPATPATGAITAIYVRDAKGGVRVVWRTVDSVWAEQVALRADEQLQFQAIASQVLTRFRTYARHDITTKMRVVWTPRWPVGAAPRYLEINGVLPYQAGDDYMLLLCGEIK